MISHHIRGKKKNSRQADGNINEDLFGWDMIGKKIYKVIRKGSLDGRQTMSRDERSGERHISGKHYVLVDTESGHYK